jgi:integrase
MGRRRMGVMPAMCRHAKTGHARVRIGTEEHWLGPWGSPEAQLRYDTLIAAWITSGRKSTEAAAPPRLRPVAVPVDLTVAELATMWLESIQAARPDDYQKSSTWNGALAAARALRKYAALPAREFGPRHLIECRQAFAVGTVKTLDKSGKVVHERPRTRRYVNDIAARVVQLFSWAVPRELVPPDRAAGLREVKPLRRGEDSKLREPEKRVAVPDAAVEAVMGHLTPTMAAMVRFIRLTGCRPGEAAGLRLAYVHEYDGSVWRYVPPQHKNAWRGLERHIPVGPRARAIMLEALGSRGENAYVFDPRSSLPRRPATAGVIPMARRCSPRVGERYTVPAIRVAVARACTRAGCERWIPYLLRYSRTGEVARSHGNRAAKATSGHKSTRMLLHYAPENFQDAALAARETG